MEESCEMCGQQTEQNNVFTKWGYQIFKCSSCQSARTIIDKDFKPADIYTEDYFQGGQKDGYADYKGSEDALTQEFKKIISCIKKYKGNGRVLEIGSAYGFFLKEAIKHFEHCSGIEISKDASDYSNTLGLKVFPVNLLMKRL